MTPAHLLDEAVEEMRDAAEYYEDQRSGLGEEFLDSLRIAVRKIQTYPNAWPLVSKTSRRCRLDRFPYGLIYQTVDQEILVLAVMHLKRKPQYWRKRER